MTINEKFKQIRLSKKMNQTEFAEILDVTQEAVSGIENGRYEPSYRSLYNLIRKLKVNTGYLFFDEEMMFIPQKTISNRKKMDKAIKDCLTLLTDLNQISL